MELLDKVIDLTSKLDKKPIIIAIDGMLGSGKSTRAEWIRDHFGKKSVVLSSDLFISVTRHQWDERLAEGDIDLATWYDLEKIRHTLERVKNRETFEVEGIYNLANGQLDKTLPIDASEAEVLILEGLFAFHDAFKDLIDVKIFLEIPHEVALERARARDEDVRNIPNAMWQKKTKIYYDQYVPYLDALRANADIVHEVNLS